MERAAPVYLLFGEETLLRDRRAIALYERLAPTENPDYNRESFQGPELVLDTVVAACETLPVCDQRRTVLVRNLNLKAAAAHPGFVAYLRRPNPTTVLILTAGAGAASGRKDKSSAESSSKRSASRGALSIKDLIGLVPDREEFTALRSDQALEFVRQAARARGVTLETDAARLLVELVGVDAARLEDEVEKAALYAGTRNRIEARDVEALVRQTRSHTVFELTDAVAEGDREAVLRQLSALFADANEPLALLGMIGWHLRRTLKGAALAETGASAADIGRAVGVQYRMQERFAATCRKLGTRKAAGAIVALRVVDRELKSAAGSDRIRLERTLLELLTASTTEP